MAAHALQSDQRCPLRQVLVLFLCVLIGVVPVYAQSNRAMLLLGGGTWHLHAHIPLGNDALLLEPAHHTVEMLASVECPEFEGWSLTTRDEKPVLLDAVGDKVKQLPTSVIFRISVINSAKLGDENPMPLNYAKSSRDFLNDMHFTVQIFRGMEMREVQATKTWMIGVPVTEPCDERIYRSQFDWGKVLPDDRVVLLVTDSAGTRLTKFHLEFL